MLNGAAAAFPALWGLNGASGLGGRREDALRRCGSVREGLFQPALLAQGLAGGAVPVAAGVVQRHLGAARVATVQAAAQRGSAAVHNAPRGLRQTARHTVRAFVLLPADS